MKKQFYFLLSFLLFAFFNLHVSGKTTGNEIISADEGSVEVKGELKQWHKVTLVLGGPSASETGSPNPFLDYKLTGVFTKGDLSFTVPGYFAADGNAAETSANSGNVWKIHFSAPETGTWNYTIHFRSGSQVAINNDINAGSAVASLDQKTGSFSIGESDKTGRDLRGKGRLKYVGKNHLQFEGNGEWFLKAGSDAPENFLAYEDFDNTPNDGGRRKSWSPHQQDYNAGDPSWQGDKGTEIIGAINYLASKGLNAFSFLTMNINGDDRNVFPYIANNKFKQFDCSKLDQWEVVFAHGEKMGMHLNFKTQETENEMLLDNGNLGTDRKLYYRELIARFGHHLALCWNLGEENGDYGNTNQNDAQRIAMAKYFHDTDPYGSNIVAHTAPGAYDKIYTPLLGNKSKLTGLSMQLHWNNVYNETKEWIGKSNNAGKPWVVACDEQGGADIGVPEDFYGGTPNRHDIRKETLWGNLIAGGAGVEYYFGYKRPESDLSCQDFRLRDMSWSYCKIALDFFNLYLPFWEMKEMNNLTSKGRCLAKVGEVYVIQLMSGGSLNLDLPAGKKFTVDWFSPKDGGALITSGLSPVTGGNNTSLGSSPNTTSDWIVLVRAEDYEHTSNQTVLVDCGSDPITMTSFDDFPNFNIDGFKPAYKDGGNQCLAIDAAQYKGEYAAAKTTFKGESGFYNIKINTLLEYDGESSYKIKIDGAYVGSFQNARTGQSGDMGAHSHTFEGIHINNGAEIQVEFNSHTNELIPEGNGTAYSRGRWKSLEFMPLCEGVPPFPVEEDPGEVEAPTWVEQNGYVVVDVESNPAYKDKNWEKKEGYSHMGSGYLEYVGNDNMGAPSASSTLTYNIKINTPGNYDFMWHTKQRSDAPTFDGWNDSWVKINADKFYCNGNPGNEIHDATKVWTQTKAAPDFVWECRAETHACGNGVTLHCTFDAPGTYSVEIAGRSKNHIVDRFVLAIPDKMETAKNQVEESKIIDAGVIEPRKFVELVSPSKSGITLTEGEEEKITINILPADASDKTVVWESSDRSVAVVDNGTIIGVSEGVAAITVSAKENKSVNHIITVVVRKKPLTSVIEHDKNIMTVLAADSWDKDFSDIGQIEFAIDDNPSTYWHTRWNQAKDPLPHWITFDLGKEVPLDEVDYLPRQDQWGPNGAIEKYEIYVTNDTSDWGDPVHIGEFSWGANPSVEDYKAMRTMKFDSTLHGRYFKILALTEDQHKADVPFSCIAELYFRTFFEGVKISSENEVMSVGNFADISLATNPFNDREKYPIKWVSTNASVASYEDGQIKALSPGFTYVIGSIFDGEYADTCLVQVKGTEDIMVGIMQNDIELIPTATASLTASTTPEANAVAWSVKDGSVATVDNNGLVTAVSAGNTLIYAEIQGGSHKDSVNVKVISPAISFDITSRQLFSGDLATVPYTVFPADSTVTWSSSNSIIATVNEGVIVAKKSGQVEISGSILNGTVKATLTLDVIKPQVVMSSVNAALKIDETLQLSASPTPDTESVSWISFNEEVVTVSDDGLITARGEGVALISAAIMDGKAKGLCEVIVTAPTGADKVFENELMLYPNPTSSLVNISDSHSIKSISIYNVQGKLLKQIQSQDNTVDMSGFENGVYLFRMKMNNNHIITKPILKQ